LSLISPVNRKVAAFVSLLYVFFSTFGALTHSHALSERAGSPAFDASRQIVFSPVASGSVPAHCPVCDWQSLQVTPPTTPPQVLQPALVRVEETAQIFRLVSLPGSRSSTRGPPLT
jgi:hypothetical protein